MEIEMLKNDGRCRWLENKVLKGLMPEAIKNAQNPFAQKMYIIVDWISNDHGRSGVDLKWFKALGLTAVARYEDLPEGNDFAVINTGYDAIVNEEKLLRERGVRIVDLPCPFARKIRKIFENQDPAYQYVYLSDANHILVKNFASIFPDDLIIVQMDNYKEKIQVQRNGKPLMLVPYVTFLPKHIDEIFQYINRTFPDPSNGRHLETTCIWVKSPTSPIVEINKLTDDQLKNIDTALLIATPGTTNKSLISLVETLEDKDLSVHTVSSLKDFLKYRSENKGRKVLLVRSPLPNKAEKPIMAFINHGWLSAMLTLFLESRWCKYLIIKSYVKAMYVKNLFVHLPGLLQRKISSRWADTYAKKDMK